MSTIALSERQKFLLVFMSLPSHPGGTSQIDPIRIMKSLFVFQHEALHKWRIPGTQYDFFPYNYGPCSFQIYQDLRALEMGGYIRGKDAAGRSWRYYEITKKGEALASSLRDNLEPLSLAYLEKLKQFFAGLSFRAMLDVIYEKYPDFAERSVFR